ncbi:MAG: efflux RND transporter periplasmic adaptor subunit [Thermodesulfobacteriota bacterium]
MQAALSGLRNKKWLVAPLVLLVVAVFLRLVVFGPPKVRAVVAEKRDLVRQVYGNGTVEARVVVNVASKITGRLVEVMVDQGDLVKAGQVLARLDQAELNEQTRQARALAEKASAGAAVERANLAKAQANQALAERNAKRFASLAAKELVSALESEQYATSAQVAQEEVSRAAAALAAADRDKAATAAGLAASEARLADAVITAPSDGVIIRRALEPGATVTSGLPILLLADPATVWVKANVDESLLAGLAVGQPARITLRSAPGRTFEGTVARLGRESDRVTEELEVDVAFSTPRADFRLGEQAEVLIMAGERRGVVALPAAAVVRQGERHGVWRLDGGRLRFREIVSGLEDHNGMVEVASGIDAGESVALASHDVLVGLAEGKRVRVTR